MANATGKFDITSMGEDTYQEFQGGGKLTRANGTQRFTGDIEGEGSVEWLMCYLPNRTARFVGLQRVTRWAGSPAASSSNPSGTTTASSRKVPGR